MPHRAYIMMNILPQMAYGSDTYNDVRNLNDTVTSLELQAGFTGAMAGEPNAPAACPPLSLSPSRFLRHSLKHHYHAGSSCGQTFHELARCTNGEQRCCADIRI